jgi:hypothetical protein
MPRTLSFFYGKNGGEEEKKREKMDIKSKLCARARERYLTTLSLPDDKMYARSDHTRY